MAHPAVLQNSCGPPQRKKMFSKDDQAKSGTEIATFLEVNLFRRDCLYVESLKTPKGSTPRMQPAGAHHRTAR